MPRIGIPYAEESVDSFGLVWAKCPECGRLIRLIERKDFESFTGREYALHYAERHPNTESE